MFDLENLSAEIAEFKLKKDDTVQLVLTLDGSKVNLEKLKGLKMNPVFVDLTSAQQSLFEDEEEKDKQ